jgi:hypothetical protein
MVLLGIDLGSNEIRVQNGDSTDEIISSPSVLRVELVLLIIFLLFKHKS